MTKATIELSRQDMKFSSAHFTIFNATERERLHGHNYYVQTKIEAAYLEPGITYDYSITRKQLLAWCRELNEYLLLPSKSPYLTIKEEGDNYQVTYNNEKMTFLKSDTKILPLENITSEELASWFLQKLISDEAFLTEKQILAIEVGVSTTRGQIAFQSWRQA